MTTLINIQNHGPGCETGVEIEQNTPGCETGVEIVQNIRGHAAVSPVCVCVCVAEIRLQNLTTVIGEPSGGT